MFWIDLLENYLYLIGILDRHNIGNYLSRIETKIVLAQLTGAAEYVDGIVAEE